MRQGRWTSQYQDVIKVTAVGGGTSGTPETVESGLCEGQELGGPSISYHAPIPVFSTVLEKTLDRRLKHKFFGAQLSSQCKSHIHT